MKLSFLVVSILLFGSTVFAASGKSFGFNVAVGAPFVTQAGINFKTSDKYSFSLGYNLLDAESGDASVTLSMPEFMINFHPLGGAFFIGVGAGQETLEAKASNAAGTGSVKFDVEASTTIIKTGWMWGSANDGFWFGIDVAYISPEATKTKLTTTNLTSLDPAYVDAAEATDDFSSEPYVNITFARLGWYF